MELIKEWVANNKLEEIQLGDGKQLTHQLFADNTRMHFLATKKEFLMCKGYDSWIQGNLLCLPKSEKIGLDPYILEQPDSYLDVWGWM